MPHLPIALQLYSIRDEVEKDMMETLAKVADMGYEGVEFAGFFGHSIDKIRARLDELGLKCAGTHTPLTEFSKDNIAETIATHQALGAKFAIVPWLPHELRSTHATALDTAKILEETSTMVAGSGIMTGFHAHDSDMHLLDQGKSAWQILAENTPDEFVMQYDTANGMSGGADPVEPILAYPGRSKSVHLKEFPAPGEPDIIGTGAVPFLKVFEACETVGGTEWYVVETESAAGANAMDCAAKCIQAIREMRAKG